MGRRPKSETAAAPAVAPAAEEHNEEFSFDDAKSGAELELDNSLDSEPKEDADEFDPFAPSQEVQKQMEQQAAKVTTPRPATSVDPKVAATSGSGAVSAGARLVPPAELKSQEAPPAAKQAVRKSPKTYTNGANGPVTDWGKVLPGLRAQLENMASTLETRNTAKAGRAILHIGQALTWITDDLRDLK